MFAGTNNPTNTDGASMSGDQRVQFAQKHPALLGEKHQVTVKNLKDLSVEFVLNEIKSKLN